MSNNYNWKAVINFTAFVAMACIGLSLLLSKIFNPGAFTQALSIVAQVLAILITAIVSFSFARSRRNVWFWLIWIVAVVLVVVSYVI